MGHGECKIIGAPTCSDIAELRVQHCNLICHGHIRAGRFVQRQRTELPHCVLQEDVAKNLLAEFNLGCQGSDVEHKYRIYVATFLGFGGNSARRRYEESLIAATSVKAKISATQPAREQVGHGENQLAEGKMNSTGTPPVRNAPNDLLMPTPAVLESVSTSGWVLLS